MASMVAKARAQAVRRVAEIRRELAEIDRAFPEIRRGRRYRRVGASRTVPSVPERNVRYPGANIH